MKMTRDCLFSDNKKEKLPNSEVRWVYQSIWCYITNIALQLKIYQNILQPNQTHTHTHMYMYNMYAYIYIYIYPFIYDRSP